MLNTHYNFKGILNFLTLSFFYFYYFFSKLRLVHLGDNSYINILDYRTIKFRTFYAIFFVSNVLYAPKLIVNLASVQKMQLKNITIKFLEVTSEFKDRKAVIKD